MITTDAAFDAYGISRAWRRREALQLNALEPSATRVAILSYLLTAGVGLLSAAAAQLLPLHLVGLAGYLYALICGVEMLHGYLEGDALRKHSARQTEATLLHNAEPICGENDPGASRQSRRSTPHAKPGEPWKHSL
jgi:hypothetical protein